MDAIDRAGHDGRALLAEAGIAPSLLDDPEARVDGPPYDRLQRLALETTGDPALGLHLGETASASAFSAPGQVASQCRTLREALEVLFTYYRLVVDAAPPRLVEEGELAHVVYEIAHSPDPLCNRLHQEFVLTLTSAIAITSFRGEGLGRDAEVWFRHARPPYAAEYTRIFGGRERFERPHAGFVVRRALLGELLQARQVHPDAELLRLLKARADELLVRLDASEGLAGMVRRMIVDAFPDASVGLDAIARRLGMSGRRVLRRRPPGGGRVLPAVGRRHGHARSRVRSPAPAGHHHPGSRAQAGLLRPERVPPGVQALDRRDPGPVATLGGRVSVRDARHGMAIDVTSAQSAAS